MLKRHFRGWHTALVVASTIFQIAVYDVFGLGEADFLDEGGCLLKEFQFHAEHLVILLDDVTLGRQFPHRLHALHLDGIERGTDRSVLAQVSGIDVPSGVDGGREDDFTFCSPFCGLQFRLEMNGVHHLSVGYYRKKEE